MNKIPKNEKVRSKAPKVVLASALGFALLLGGSTYALWSATDSAESSSTISTGDLVVTAASPQNWFNTTDPGNAVEIPDLSSFKLSPGQSLQLKQDLNVIVVGDNMTGTLKVVVPNNTLSAPLMSQAVFTLSLLNKDGVEIGAVTPAVNTSDSLTLQTLWLPRTPASGELYTVELSVQLPTNVDNTTIQQTVNLGDMAITLTQGAGILPDNVGPTRMESAIVAPTAEANVPFSMTVKAKGSGTMSYTATGLPSGLTMAPVGIISGTPKVIGTSLVGITATNGATTATSTLSLTIEGASSYHLTSTNGSSVTYTGHMIYTNYDGNPSPESYRKLGTTLVGGETAIKVSNLGANAISPIKASGNLDITITGLKANSTFNFSASAEANGNPIVFTFPTQAALAPVTLSASGAWQGTTTATGTYTFTVKSSAAKSTYPTDNYLYVYNIRGTLAN